MTAPVALPPTPAPETTAPPAASRAATGPAAGGAPPARTFRPDLQGLRALAVLLVVLDHAGLAGLAGGYVGVDVFFVLSGFLITGLLLREADASGRVSLLQFWARRARRVLPAAAAVLLATLVAAWLLLDPTTAADLARDARWVAVFAANAHFAALGTDYLTSTAPPSALQHYWSLAVEEQFYLLWPVVLLALAALGRRCRLPLRPLTGAVLAVLVAASVRWSVHLTAVSAPAAYFSPLVRSHELAVGAALAVALPALRRLRVPARAVDALGVAGLLAVVAAAVLFDGGTPFPGTAVLLPVLGTAAVVAAGSLRAGGAAERLLAVAPARRLGDLSYALYLVHWPVLVLAAARAGHPLALPVRVQLVVLSLAVAAAAHVLLENPVRRSPRLVARPWLSVALGLALVAGSLGAATAVLAGQPGAGPGASAQAEGAADVLTEVAAAAGTRRLPDLVTPLGAVPQDRSAAYTDACHARYEQSSSRLCSYGDRTAAATIVLLGDSHATQWLPALDRIGTATHHRVVLVTKSSCPVPTVPTWSDQAKRPYTECTSFHAAALAAVAAMHPDLVVASDTYGAVYAPTEADRRRLWLDGLGRALRALRAGSGRVVLLRDTPRPATVMTTCLSGHADDVTSCATSRAVAVDAAFEARQAEVAQAAGAQYVDTTPWFCTDRTCPAVVAGTVVDFDATHMSATYSRHLAPALQAALHLGAAGG